MVEEVENNGMRNGFTLVETLVVIAIIATLMTMLGVAVSGVTSTAKEQTTKATIEKIEAGVSSFESTLNRLPHEIKRQDELSDDADHRWPPDQFEESGIFVGFLGQELSLPGPKDPQTGKTIRTRVVGPFIKEFEVSELGIAGEKTGKRGAGSLKKPESRNFGEEQASQIRIVDGWGREMCVNFPGSNHANQDCDATNNNTDWFDFWSWGVLDREKSQIPTCPSGSGGTSTGSSEPKHPTGDTYDPHNGVHNF